MNILKSIFKRKDKELDKLYLDITKRTQAGMEQTWKNVREAQEIIRKMNKEKEISQKDKEFESRYLEINHKLNNYIMKMEDE